MAKTIKIKNPVLPQNEETFLTTKYTAGVTALIVKNNDGWVANDIVVAGYPGQENTEQKQLSTLTSNNQLNISATYKFNHPISTPLFKSKYNQISLEQKVSGGSFAVIAEGLKDIQWDEKDGFTKIDVATGDDSDTYRWRFYNSASASYSIYSGELPGTGLTPFYAGFQIARIRKYGKIPANLGITDLDILEMLNDGQRDIDTRAPGGRWWFTLTEDSDATRITAVAGTYKYGLPSTYRAMDVLKILDINSQLYNLKFIPRIEFDSYIRDQATSARSDSTVRWTLLPPDTSNTIGYFGVSPIPATTGIYFYRRYWRYLPTLTSFASQILIPLPDTLFNWGMHKLYRMREDGVNADKYLGYYFENIKQLEKMENRQVGQPEMSRYRGPKGFNQLFGGNVAVSNDDRRENYW
jgi:hypothetical protein